MVIMYNAHTYIYIYIYTYTMCQTSSARQAVPPDP